MGAKIWASEPIGRRRRPREDRSPIVDALSVAALEFGAFIRRRLGDDQQVEEVAVEVCRLTEELGVGQDEAVRSYRERGDLGLGPRLAQDVRRIADQLESGVVVTDPALDRPFQPAPTGDELAAAAKIFREQATQAAAALTTELCPAAATWRKILGQNENGWVFPLPEGCDASGNAIKKIIGVSASGSDEARGFAES